MVEGFRPSSTVCPEKPVAISFAFPGPAGYRTASSAVICPTSRRSAKAWRWVRSSKRNSGIPVYINNDGDLFACGENAGRRPARESRPARSTGKPEEIQKPRRLHLRHGTRRGPCDRQPAEPRRQLARRDVLPASENARNHRRTGRHVRAVKRVYGELGDVNHAFEPKDICRNRRGKRPGMSRPRRRLFLPRMGEIAGDAMATSRDAGGRPDRHRRRHHGGPQMDHAQPAERAAFEDANSTATGLNRVQMKVYDLDDETEFREFAKGAQRP